MASCHSSVSFHKVCSAERPKEDDDIESFFHFMFPPTLHNHMNAVICVVIEILTHHASWKVSKLHFSVNGALSDSYSWGGRLFSGERSLKSRSGGLKVMGTDSVFQV